MIESVLIVLAGFGGAALGWFLCSRYHKATLDAALTVTEVGTSAAGKVLDAAAEQRVLGDRMDLNAQKVLALEKAVMSMKSSLDSLDTNQGSMLNMFINSGLAKVTGPGGARQEQYGETPVTQVDPPPFDPTPGAKADDPLDEVVV